MAGSFLCKKNNKLKKKTAQYAQKLADSKIRMLYFNKPTYETNKHLREQKHLITKLIMWRRYWLFMTDKKKNENKTTLLTVKWKTKLPINSNYVEKRMVNLNHLQYEFMTMQTDGGVLVWYFHTDIEDNLSVLWCSEVGEFKGSILWLNICTHILLVHVVGEDSKVFQRSLRKVNRIVGCNKFNCHSQDLLD